MSLTVICTLSLVFSTGGINVIQNGQLEGEVKFKNSSRYLVDFSIDARKQEVIGDYSNRLVSKSDCIEKQ